MADLSTAEGAQQLVENAPAVDVLVNKRRLLYSERPSSIIKRFILPQEVADLVVNLCSPLAAATNGAAVRIDGGVIEAIP